MITVETMISFDQQRGFLHITMQSCGDDKDASERLRAVRAMFLALLQGGDCKIREEPKSSIQKDFETNKYQSKAYARLSMNVGDK